jgi:CheY-like chemotaxis protein
VIGWGQENDKRMAHAAGFDHHLTKPVDPDRLAELLTPDDLQRLFFFGSSCAFDMLTGNAADR